MIRNTTARQMLYDWHSGMGSPFYAAASSGLVASFVALADECVRMDDAKDRQKLLTWIQRMQATSKQAQAWDGRSYYVLPWGDKNLTR